MKTGASLLTCALAACTSISSADIKTAGMSAHMSVTADGTGASEASATLNVDTSPTDFVNLTGTDTLTASAASAGSASEPMGQSNLLGIITYNASFSGESASGTQYTIDLNRPTDTSAPNSSCTLPDAFAIESPDGGATFSRATGTITVSWSPSGSGDQMSLQADGSCIQPFLQSVSGDPGTATIAPGGLVADTSGQQASNCQVALTLSRQRTGTLDPAFGYGGSIVCGQTRTVSLLSTP